MYNVPQRDTPPPPGAVVHASGASTPELTISSAPESFLVVEKPAGCGLSLVL